MNKANPVFCAIDTSDLHRACALADKLNGHVGGIKLGLEFFLAHGRDGYNAIAKIGLPIFLDLKLHDIPNTVAGALGSVLPLEPAFLTIHASGGEAMMRAAVDATKKVGAKTKLLAVTVLTSLNGDDLGAVGQGTDAAEQVVQLARLAQQAGLDGVICSPEEIEKLRSKVGPDFILMVPGIRPAWASTQDQKRVKTPFQAIAAGASYLVIGRPITAAADPVAAAQKIQAELV